MYGGLCFEGAAGEADKRQGRYERGFCAVIHGGRGEQRESCFGSECFAGNKFSVQRKQLLTGGGGGVTACASVWRAVHRDIKINGARGCLESWRRARKMYKSSACAHRRTDSERHAVTRAVTAAVTTITRATPPLPAATRRCHPRA